MHDMTIAERLMNFSVRIVRLSRFVRESKNDHILSNQILRSGTPIGANYEEACGAISKPDCIAKVSISLKEARETLYWLRLLYKVDMIDERMYASLERDCDAIVHILGKTIRTAKQSAQKPR